MSLDYAGRLRTSPDERHDLEGERCLLRHLKRARTHQAPDSGLVFTWPDGRPIHPARFSDWFGRHAEQAGLPRIALHDVRHSYATAALKAGVPVKVIGERLGHANVGITLDVYSHVIPGMDEQAASAVASLILGADGASPQAPLTRSSLFTKPWWFRLVHRP
jgi:integrase